MTTLPESSVLKPLDPVPHDVNDWPDFALRDVKIFYQGKGRYADLLEASEDVPLCVLGELMPLDDEEQENLGEIIAVLPRWIIPPRLRPALMSSGTHTQSWLTTRSMYD